MHSTLNNSLAIRAKEFATAAHAAVGQVRKYTNEQYIVHPIEVAEMVAAVGGSVEMVSAAYLHDVVEDTQVELALIRELFGEEVASLVYWLTDVSRPEDGNRAARAEKNRLHTAAAPAAAKTIKLADTISNTRSVIVHDKKFAKVYLMEKQLLLEHLKEGDSRLYKVAEDIIRKWNEVTA